MAATRKTRKPSASDDDFRNMMDAFSFTAADLKANNDGLISDRQRQRLGSMGKSLTNYSKLSIKFMIGFVIIAGGAILLMLLSNESTRKSLFGSTSSLAILLVALPVPILIFVAYYFVTRRQRVQYENAKLKLAEGRASVKKKTSGGRYGPNQFWEFKVGDFKLNLLEEYAQTLTDGAIYRVYYTQVGKMPTILSIEETG